MRILVATALLVVGLVTTPVIAGFNYSLEAASVDATTLGNTAFDLSSTGGGTINLYLVQRPDGGDVATTFNSVGTNFRLNRTAGTAAVAQAVAGPHLLRNLTGSTPPTVYQWNNGSFPPPGPASTLVNGFETILVGTMNITGPDGSSVSFDFADTVGDSIDVNGTPNMDATIIGNSRSFTVAVPEPSGVGLATMFVLAAAGIRRRRA